MVHVGALVEDGGEDWVRLSLQTDERHADRWGRIHTGVLTSVMDSVIGIALGRARGEAGRGRPHATIEMNTSFYAQGVPGDHLVSEGRIMQLAELYAFGEVDARRSSDGALLAKARMTFAIPGRRD
jgi:acyl-coenzyme A thioesterase PaaI-like protein